MGFGRISSVVIVSTYLMQQIRATKGGKATSVSMDVYSWFRRKPKQTTLPSSATALKNHPSFQNDDEQQLQLYGVTEQLVDFIKPFTVDTFINFSLPDEGEANGDDGDGAPTTSGNIRKDLSDWQERHATLVLSKVKELSQLRFRLCPRYLKEQQFWRIYFTLVKGYVTEYELHAIRLAILKQMKVENESSSNTNSCEVEMSETKQVAASEVPAASLEHD